MLRTVEVTFVVANIFSVALHGVTIAIIGWVGLDAGASAFATGCFD